MPVPPCKAIAASRCRHGTLNTGIGVAEEAILPVEDELLISEVCRCHPKECYRSTEQLVLMCLTVTAGDWEELDQVAPGLHVIRAHVLDRFFRASQVGVQVLVGVVE